MGTTDKNVKPIASVLVVDDEESIRFSLSRFLQMENYQVFTASNIDEAVKILQEENVNLAILDLALSNAQNGEELVQYIYSTHLDCEMIMMSGYWFATSELTRGILRLQKPFTRKDIVELVEQSLTLRNNRLSKVREKILLQGIHLESEGGKAFLSNVLKLIINITQAQAGIITCKNSAQKTATAFLPFCQSPDDVQLPDPEF
ncbi:MAG: response regulator, partial [Calditrichaeota bacterium]|nr:response regulator [Calditrichota bacterium]